MFANDLTTVFVGARNRKFHNETADRDIRVQLANDSFITERALTRLSYALHTEQIVTAWCFHCVFKDVQTNWTKPSII